MKNITENNALFRKVSSPGSLKDSKNFLTSLILSKIGVAPCSRTSRGAFRLAAGELESTPDAEVRIQAPIIVEFDEDQDSLFKQGYKKNSNGTFSPMPLSEMYPFTNKPISNTNN